MNKRRKTEFHQIVVKDHAGFRTLEFSGVVQSSMRVDNPSDGGLEYVDFFHIPFLLRESIRRVLFIGLGGGSGPTQFLEDYPEVKLDVVEIDPGIVEVAEELFAFSTSPRCRIHIEDGLDFLEASRSRWDLIIIDAYMIERGELVVPRELTTETFFELCRRRLSRNGVLVFNSAAAAAAVLTQELRDSLSEIFPYIIGFEAVTSDNTVLLASSAPLETRKAALVKSAREGLTRGRVRRESLIRRSRQLHRGLTETG